MLSSSDQPRCSAGYRLTSQCPEDRLFGNTRCRNCENFLYVFKGARSAPDLAGRRYGSAARSPLTGRGAVRLLPVTIRLGEP